MGTVETSGREDEFNVKDSEVRGPGLPWLALVGNSLLNADRQKGAVYLAVACQTRPIIQTNLGRKLPTAMHGTDALDGSRLWHSLSRTVRNA